MLLYQPQSPKAGTCTKGISMLPLSGLFSDISDDFPEVRAARRAYREYIACLLAAVLLPGLLFLLYALTN